MWTATLLAGVSISVLFGPPTASAQNMMLPSSSDFFRGTSVGQAGSLNQQYHSSASSSFASPSLGPSPTSAQPNAPANANTSASGSETSPAPSPGAASTFPENNPLFTTAVREGGSGTVTPEGYQLVPNAESYNFKIGSAFFRLSADLRLEATDNVYNSSSDREGDIIATPEVTLKGHWQISTINDVTLNLGIGYNWYVEHPSLSSVANTFQLSPASNFSFRIKMGDVYLRFYERPTVGQDTSNSLTLPSDLLYYSLTNDIGFSVYWDLNALQIQGGYDRMDVVPFGTRTQAATTNSAQTQANTSLVNSLRQSTDSLFASATLKLSDATSVGLQGTASVITYHGGAKNNGDSYYAGAFLGTQLTDYISMRLSAGYQIMDFQSGGTNQIGSGPSKSTGPYGIVSFNHHLNRFISHSLSFTYESILGTTTDSVKTTSVSEQIAWKISDKMTVNVGASYTVGEESGPFGQSLRGFQASASTGWSLSRKLRMGLYYQFSQRTGGENANNVSGPFANVTNAGSYYENQLGLNFSYAF